MVEKLLPGAHILSRPRLSQLVHSGDRKMTRLPRRSAIVAFSAEEVYAIAELIRRQRGGAAVVLGALSPRTRNAQVELYQSGDVDYLVATDAIGMGLNLDVDHVAFASDRKFDGYQFRRLNPVEFAQIAGRAGRATRDGTFGTTGRCEPFEPELVHALESHSFEPMKVMQWRNTQLNFSSVAALQASLAEVPVEPGLTRAPVAEDIRVLEHAARDEQVRHLAQSRPVIERLWEVCQVPDYRKISPAMHAELVITLFDYLVRDGKLPVDWFAQQIALADRTEGDIDTLSTRIAHIRTWTFAATRPDWLADPEHWQGVTRAVEDKLSDALHEQLLHRFVDRRTSVLMRRLRENAMLETEISKSGDVSVEGHPLGRIEGFRFVADASAGGPEAKALRTAAQKALAGEIEARASRLSAASDDAFALASDGTLRWLGDAVGKLAAADHVLRPQIRIIADEQLTGPARESVQARLDLWIKAYIEKLLGPLVALERAEDITGMARGIAFQLAEATGVLERQKVGEEIKGLDQTARALLRNYGVRFGAYHIYLPALLKPAPRVLAMQLWALKHESPDVKGLEELPQLAASGRTSIPIDKDIPKVLYRTVGYRVCGERALRVDILERLADLIRPALAWRPASLSPKPPGALDGSGFIVTGAMTSLAGASGEDFASILRSLGYRLDRRPKPPEPKPAAEPAMTPAPDADAALEVLSAQVQHILDDVSGDAPEQNPVALGLAPIVPEETQAAADARQSPMSDDASPAASAEMSQPDMLDPRSTVALDAVAEGEAPVAPNDSADSIGNEASAAVPEGSVAPTDAPNAAEAAPEFIDVWRPGRYEGRGPSSQRHGQEARHRPSRRPRSGQPDRQDGGPPQAPRMPGGRSAPDGSADPGAAATDVPTDAAISTRDRPGRPGRSFRGKEDRKPRHDPSEQREGGRFKGRGARSERGNPPDRAPGSQAAPRSHIERREKPPDPNSPFAKLLALKEQLEANTKTPR
jgi:ATP-dependent RNA helicase SUPV3L1/SUV3